MKLRRFDQLWNRWLLVENDLTFDEWLNSLRERRETVKQQSKQAQIWLDTVHKSANYKIGPYQAFGGMLGGLGGLFSQRPMTHGDCY